MWVSGSAAVPAAGLLRGPLRDEPHGFTWGATQAAGTAALPETHLHPACGKPEATDRDGPALSM